MLCPVCRTDMEVEWGGGNDQRLICPKCGTTKRKK